MQREQGQWAARAADLPSPQFASHTSRRFESTPASGGTGRNPSQKRERPIQQSVYPMAGHSQPKLRPNSSLGTAPDPATAPRHAPRGGAASEGGGPMAQPKWFTPGRLLGIFIFTSLFVYLDRGAWLPSLVGAASPDRFCCNDVLHDRTCPHVAACRGGGDLQV